VELFAHRGPMHSLAFAVVVGAIVAALMSSERRMRMGMAATAVVASHGLLDALGDSTVGVELLWPFSDVRWLAPWHPLPNVDLARPLTSTIGVVLLEVLLFAPAFVYALLPRTWLRTSDRRSRDATPRGGSSGSRRDGG
jgi:membrane-bound metal-dependent hydrolase YbcI (DUF457 family)